MPVKGEILLAAGPEKIDLANKYQVLPFHHPSSGPLSSCPKPTTAAHLYLVSYQNHAAPLNPVDFDYVLAWRQHHFVTVQAPSVPQ